ncbi:unnamed protein product [Amoebophrya sp. A120]|nr:unnamed protein product [Amoebophrya sp. A120]|eukprot:GSA120T00026083001.1
MYTVEVYGKEYSFCEKTQRVPMKIASRKTAQIVLLPELGDPDVVLWQPGRNSGVQ